VWHDRDTGLLCKGRLDWWVPDRLFVDLKTSRDVHRFEREIAKHNYDMQMALYFDGLFAVTGYGHCKHIAAVETTAPFGVRAATVSADVIESGRSKYKRLLRQYKQCQQDDDWPGYTDPEQWVMPDWGYDSDNVQLTMNGKKI
jgi:exodeoxyribonuclease VIII